jgi:hypothetical protein
MEERRIKAMRTITANSCGTTRLFDVLNAAQYGTVNVVDLDGKTLGIVENRKDARGGSRFFCDRQRISYDKLWVRMQDWSDVISGQNARDYKRRVLVENDKTPPTTSFRVGDRVDDGGKMGVIVSPAKHPTPGEAWVVKYDDGSQETAGVECLRKLPALTELEQARVQVALLVEFITDAPDRYTSMNPYGRPEVRAALKYLATGALGNAPTCERLCDIDYEAADNTLRKLGVAIPYQAEVAK